MIVMLAIHHSFLTLSRVEETRIQCQIGYCNPLHRIDGSLGIDPLPFAGLTVIPQALAYSQIAELPLKVSRA